MSPFIHPKLYLISEAAKKQLLADIEALQGLFTSSEKWTQFELARNVTGQPVQPNDESATCFCLDGGVAKRFPLPQGPLDILNKTSFAALMERRRHIRFALAGAIGEDKYEKVIQWNDDPERTFEDVTNMLAQAHALVTSF